MRGRAAVLLAFTMAVGPGLLVNGILKQEWGRPRPVHVDTFGGRDAFKSWYETDGTCPGNCSFVSGEGALVIVLVVLTRYFLYDRKGAPRDAAVELIIGRTGLKLRTLIQRVWRRVRRRPLPPPRTGL